MVSAAAGEGAALLGEASLDGEPDGLSDGLAEALADAALVQPAAPPRAPAGSAGSAPAVPDTALCAVPSVVTAVPSTGAGSPLSFGQVTSALSAEAELAALTGVACPVACGLLGWGDGLDPSELLDPSLGAVRRADEECWDQPPCCARWPSARAGVAPSSSRPTTVTAPPKHVAVRTRAAVRAFTAVPRFEVDDVLLSERTPLRLSFGTLSLASR